VEGSRGNERLLVEGMVAEAVKQGKLWLTSGQASILAEEIPAGLFTYDARADFEQFSEKYKN
jgi:hypothetical protein